MESVIRHRRVFEQLVFAQCWEDPELDLEALAPEAADRVLVVTSGGCTALAVLACGVQEVIAIDLNETQNFLLELKLAAIRALGHEEVLSLLGVRFAQDEPPRAASAVELYARVRAELGPGARAYWDAHGRAIERGVLGSGRYESYLALFRRLLRLVVGRKTVADLFRQPLAEQERFYRERWDSARWRLLFRLFFSRYFLGRQGLDPAFFAHVQGVPSFGEYWRGRAEHVLTALPVRTNYFLAQIGLGGFLDRETVPRYLQLRHFEALKQAAGRVRIVTEPLESFLSHREPDSLDKFALSNVFEWVDERSYTQILRHLWRVGRPGARLAYRNLLVHRERPESLAAEVTAHRAAARALLPRDRSFVYSNFVIEEIRKEPGTLAQAPPDAVAEPALGAA